MGRYSPDRAVRIGSDTPDASVGYNGYYVAYFRNTLSGFPVPHHAFLWVVSPGPIDKAYAQPRDSPFAAPSSTLTPILNTPQT